MTEITAVDYLSDLDNITASDGLVVLVKNHSSNVESEALFYVYDSNQLDTNNGGTIYNGWIAQLHGYVTPEMFGAINSNRNVASTNTTAFNLALDFINSENGLHLKIPVGTYYVDGVLTIYSSTVVHGNYTQLSSKGSVIRFTTSSAKFFFNNALGTIFKELMCYHEASDGVIFDWDTETSHNYNYFDSVYCYGGRIGYKVTRALYIRWFRCRTVTSADAETACGILFSGITNERKIDAPEILQCSFSGQDAVNSTCIKIDGAVHSLKIQHTALLYASYGLRTINSASTSIFPKFIYISDSGTENCLIGMSFEAGNNIKLSNIYASNTTTELSNAAINTESEFEGELSITNAEITGSHQIGARFLGGNIRLNNSWIGNTGESDIEGVGIRLGDVNSAIIIGNRIGNKSTEGGAYQAYGIQFSFTSSVGDGIIIKDNDMRANLNSSFNSLSTAIHAKISDNFTVETVDYVANSITEDGTTSLSLVVARYILNNASSLTSYTLVLPTNPLDGHTIEISFTNAITTLNLSSSITINNNISTLSISAMQTFKIQYRAASTRWYILL
ncbi:MAG: hypothetical protein QM666_04470 [Acinetobacter sp.]